MRTLHTSFLALVLLAAACEPKPQIPSAQKQNYPVVISDSPERRALAEREWRRMLDAYGVPQTPPDLYPIIHTPRSLLGVTGGLKIINKPPVPGAEDTATREAVKVFIDRWRDLLGVDPATVSLVGGEKADGAERLTYRQAAYPLPIAGLYGEMVVVISADGRLLQLDNRFIPVVDVPLRPTIDRDAARQRVVGRSFTYSDIAGREQRLQVTNPGEIDVRRLVILPIERSDSIGVHLAWEVVAGTSLTWNVYIDAATGDELRVVQNFRT